MKVRELTNVSNSDIDVTLIGGTKVTLSPRSTLKNADITDAQDLSGKVKVVGDLTEVTAATGRTRIDG
jgi:hypothetical protein